MASPTSPFHSGSLQSGISLAIQQQKLVACFIHGDDDVSDIWLSQLTSRRYKQGTQTTGEVIGTRAVLLRLELGSQEANFLNAFCPVTQAPMLVIINNGQVLERVDGSVGEDEWFQRVEKAIGVTIGTDGEEDARQEESSTAPAPVATVAAPSPPVQAEAATVVEPRATNSISDLFPDRNQRLEAEKKQREEAQKAELLARQNARRKEAEAAQTMHKGKNNESLEKEKARRDWLVQQKLRKDEAKRERERILAQIAADRAERKARHHAREDTEGASSPLTEASMAAMKRTMGAGGRCDLSVRLFDGGSIRGRFEPHATLGKTVRDWIAEETGDSYDANRRPFHFRHILAPQPSRSIDVTEEQQTLVDLGMVPTATLVLVPVPGYQEAYSSGAGGILATTLNAPYALLIWLWTLLSSLLFSRAGSAAQSDHYDSQSIELPDSHAAASSALDAAPSSARNRMKTLADQRVENERERNQKAEFYNGNSLGFEGKKDDDEDAGQ